MQDKILNSNQLLHHFEVAKGDELDEFAFSHLEFNTPTQSLLLPPESWGLLAQSDTH